MSFKTAKLNGSKQLRYMYSEHKTARAYLQSISCHLSRLLRALGESRCRASVIGDMGMVDSFSMLPLGVSVNMLK